MLFSSEDNLLPIAESNLLICDEKPQCATWKVQYVVYLNIMKCILIGCITQFVLMFTYI